MAVVKEDQFQVSEVGVLHVPTGHRFVPYPERPSEGAVLLGPTAQGSSNSFRLKEVSEMMKLLWKKTSSA